MDSWLLDAARVVGPVFGTVATVLGLNWRQSKKLEARTKAAEVGEQGLYRQEINKLLADQREDLERLRARNTALEEERDKAEDKRRTAQRERDEAVDRATRAEAERDELQAKLEGARAAMRFLRGEEAETPPPPDAPKEPTVRTKPLRK